MEDKNVYGNFFDCDPSAGVQPNHGRQNIFRIGPDMWNYYVDRFSEALEDDWESATVNHKMVSGYSLKEGLSYAGRTMLGL